MINLCPAGIPIAIPGGSFGPGYGDINLSGLRCNGMEPNLTACFRSPSIFSGFCTHSDDGGVLCPRMYLHRIIDYLDTKYMYRVYTRDPLIKEWTLLTDKIML